MATKTYRFRDFVIETTTKLKPGDVVELQNVAQLAKTAKAVDSSRNWAAVVGYFRVEAVAADGKLTMQAVGGQYVLEALLYDNWSGTRPQFSYRAEDVVFSFVAAPLGLLFKVKPAGRYTSEAVKAIPKRSKYRVVEAVDEVAGTMTVTCIKKVIPLRGKSMLTYALEDLG